jgi:hypothetical protein
MKTAMMVVSMMFLVACGGPEAVIDEELPVNYPPSGYVPTNAELYRDLYSLQMQVLKLRDRVAVLEAKVDGNGTVIP